MRTFKQFTYRLLRHSERYTKTDMVYVTRGSFWLLFATVITTGITLGLAVAFSHLVPKEVYGNYKFALSLADIVGAFSLVGIGIAVSRGAARKLHGSLRQGLLLSLRWSVPMILLASAGALYYVLNDNLTLATELAVVAIFLPIISSAGLYNAYLEGRTEFKFKSLLSVVRTGIPSAALLLTILHTDDPALIVLAFFASHAITTTVLYFFVERKFVQNNETSPDMIHYSKHFSLMNIVNTIASQIDKVLIFHFLGGTELAIYAFATLVPQHVSGIFNIASTLAFPKFAQKDLKTIHASVRTKTLQLGIIILAVSISYIFTAPYLYAILFPTYVEAVVYSQAGIFIMIGLLSLLAGTALKAAGTVRELHIITLSTSILQIIILIPAVMWFGLWGAIAATITTKVTKVILTLYYFNRAALANPSI